jgi:hypothetical protein
MTQSQETLFGVTQLHAKRIRRRLCFQVGDIVTTREAKPAFYSEYAGNPKQWFEPGMIGIVAAVDVPAVRQLRGYPDTYCCVDFVGTSDHSRRNRVWRVSLYASNMVHVTAYAEGDCLPMGKFWVNWHGERVFTPTV